MQDLEKALQQYRILHTPTQLSVYQFWANQTFSKDDLLECPESEREEFYDRIEEGKVTFCKRITDKEGTIGTLHTLLNIITDPSKKDINKNERMVIYSSNDGLRPIGTHAFDQWGGFQVIDMDIKNRSHAEYLKEHIFKSLVKYNWFLGVSFSSSGKGLHVYTKIRVGEDDQNNPQKKKLLYLTNFRHKYSFVYLACTRIIEKMKNDDGTEVTKDQLMKWLDFAMFKPQQGAFIGYDEHPYINTHFFEDFIYVNFDNVEDMGHPDVDWVTYPDLKEAFKRWEWFEENDKPADIEIKDAPLLEIDTHNKIHYKHFERWKLANTLVRLYGLEQGYKYMRMICSADIPTKEIQADCVTASRHKKEIEPWAVHQLNKVHGFSIKVNIDKEEKTLDVLYNNINDIENPTLIRKSPNTKTYYIKHNEYLGNIKNQILRDCGMITLIEAGAGLGKTETVKQIVREGKRVLLVMPFTSTIKSKVEDDPLWDYAYGNRKVKFDNKPGIALTIDKFSRLNMMDLKNLGFDYIFIDESHLMFQSEYRPVMAKVIEMIRNTEVPIILMSGTPVGETVFFDDIIHLKVIKEDLRQKEFKVFLADRPMDSLCYMCQSMASDIANGRRVLFPTNKGSIFKEQIEVMVQYFLEKQHQIFRHPIVRYYKKANLGEEFMDKVNFEKTVADTDVLLCSTYLSVGVDILDKFEFNIYFSELWMPQEIEQFANRLRSHDLFINIYLNRKNAEGESLDIINYKHCNFALDDDEVKDVYSIIRSCNAMIERNPVEYRYNPLVASITRDNKFIEYNEIENKFYLNEIAYKTIMFERKYRDYVQQLPVLTKGMMQYGYRYSSVELGEFHGNLDEDFIKTDDLKDLIAQAKRSEQSRSTAIVDELMELITEDRLHIYKDVLGGVYEIKKGTEWKEDNIKKEMIVKNVEVFEKVIPLFLSLSKMFDVGDIKEIFSYCQNKNYTYNFAAIKRVRQLTNIIYNNKQDRLDIPIKQYIESVYKFVDGGSERKRVEIERFINECTKNYAMGDSTDQIIITNSPLTIQKYHDRLYELFKCLVNVGRPNKEKVIHLEKVELLWIEKNEKVKNFNEQIKYLDNFLDNMKPSESRIDMSKVDIEL